jgi:hypothetical protein
MATPKSTFTSRIDINGAEQFTAKRVVRGVRGATLEGERIVKDVLSQPGSGELYIKGRTKHRASAPGEAPAPNTGQLRNSTSSEVLRVPGGATGQVIVAAEHALPLEIGTETIKPRPFISRLLTEYAARLVSAFTVSAKGGS